MKYSIMLQKGALPLGVVIVMKIILMVLKTKGIEIDEKTVVEYAMCGYAGLVMFINWLKHHKDPSPKEVKEFFEKGKDTAK